MDAVEHYVMQLYSGGPTAADANAWLTQFQQSDEAWGTSIQLLMSSATTQVQIFSANVLLQKSRLQISALGDTTRDELIAAVLSQAEITSTDAGAVRRTLFAAAAAATAFHCSDYEILSAHFRKPHIGSLSTTTICEYLTALGQEYTSRSDRLQIEVRNQLVATVLPVLSSACSAVTATMASTESSGQEDTMALQHRDALIISFVNSVASWGAVGLDFVHLLGTTDILSFTVDCLGASDTKFFRAAADALTECAVATTSTRRGGVSAHHAMQLASVLLPALGDNVTPRFAAAVAGGASSDDNETCCLICTRLVVEVGRVVLPVLTASDGTSLQPHVATLLNMLVESIAHDNAAIVESAVAFLEDLVAAVGMTAQWLHLLDRIFSAVLSRFQYPASFTTWEDSDVDEDDFRGFRRHARSLLQAIACMQPDHVVHTMSARLTSLTGASSASLASWPQLEVLYFAAASVAQEVVPAPQRVRRSHTADDARGTSDRDVVVEAFFARILRPQSDEPTQHFLVRQAMMHFVACYSHWFPQHPDRMGTVVATVLADLHNTDAVVAAADALQALCAACPVVVAANAHLSDLIATATAAAYPTSAAGTVAEALIRAVACCPVDAAQGHVRALVQPVHTALQTHMAHVATHGSLDAVAAPIAQVLHVLARILRFLDILPVKAQDGAHTAVMVFRLLSGELDAVHRRFLHVERVHSALCGVCDAVIHSGKVDSLEVVPSILSMMLTSLEQTMPEPHMLAPFETSLEYHGQLAPVASGVSMDVRKDVLSYFGKVLDLVFQRLHLESPEFTARTPVYSAYLDLATRMAIFSPESLAESACLPNLLRFAQTCIASDAREAFRSACPFLSRALQSNHYELYIRVQEWLKASGRDLCASLFHAVVSTAPLDIILKPAELVFVTCSAIDADDVPAHLIHALEATPAFQGGHAEAVGMSSHLLQALQGSKAQFVQDLCEFGKSCRL
eukprot:m.1075472 g.1075472  ORF g.1075472 m.1075472 type:complete len:968 (+) comp24241_c0_seq6:272-3175(+)